MWVKDTSLCGWLIAGQQTWLSAAVSKTLNTHRTALHIWMQMHFLLSLLLRVTGVDIIFLLLISWTGNCDFWLCVSVCWCTTFPNLSQYKVKRLFSPCTRGVTSTPSHTHSSPCKVSRAVFADDLNANKRQHISCMWAVMRLRYQGPNYCPQVPSWCQALSTGLGEQNEGWVKSCIIVLNCFCQLNALCRSFVFLSCLLLHIPSDSWCSPIKLRLPRWNKPTCFMLVITALHEKKEIYSHSLSEFKSCWLWLLHSASLDLDKLVTWPCSDS